MIFNGMAQLPGAMPGVFYVDSMKVMADPGGGTALVLGDGTGQLWECDYDDPSMYVQAEGLGYGRQLAVMLRDHVLVRAVLAAVGRTEPRYMFDTAPRAWPDVDRVQLVQRCLTFGRSYPGSDYDAIEALRWLRILLCGGGHSA